MIFLYSLALLNFNIKDLKINKKKSHKLDNQVLIGIYKCLLFISVKTTLNKFGSFKEVLIFTVKFK